MMTAMAKWRRILVSLVCLVAMVVLVRHLLRDTEPRYRDIPLSDWIALHRSYTIRGQIPFVLFIEFREVSGRDTLGPEAADAIRQIGTNALPVLINWMNLHRSPWKTTIARAVAKLPRSVRPAKLPAWVDPAKEYERASLAYSGFLILGAAAAPAIPDLVSVACNTQALGSASAVDVLVRLNKPAVPALAGMLTDSRPKEIQNRVMNGLGYIGLDAVEAIPALVSCLNHSDEELAALSAATLARIQQRPDLAVPALIVCLDDSRDLVRLAAAKALGDFGSDASPAAAKLTSLLVQPDIHLSREAGRALEKIAPSSFNEPFATEFISTLDGFGPQP